MLLTGEKGTVEAEDPADALADPKMKTATTKQGDKTNSNIINRINRTRAPTMKNDGDLATASETWGFLVCKHPDGLTPCLAALSKEMKCKANKLM